jgi:hypothetical protein
MKNSNQSTLDNKKIFGVADLMYGLENTIQNRIKSLDVFKRMFENTE